MDVVEKLEELKALDRKCSITLGTPAKGGEVKIYFDPSDLEDAQVQVENAYAIFVYARIRDSMLRDGLLGLEGQSFLKPKDIREEVERKAYGR